MSLAKSNALQRNQIKFLFTFSQSHIHSLNKTNLKKEDDFKYLGSWISESSKDFNVKLKV